MLDVIIIEPIEESKWIIPMVVQYNKTNGEVCIYIDLTNLNDAIRHNPFRQHLEMKYWRVSRDKKYILLLMGSLVTIRSELKRKIDTRQPLR